MTRVVEPALTALRQHVLRMGSLAEAILEKALQSVWRRDASLAREVKIDDLEIDRLDVAIDELVLRILATQACGFTREPRFLNIHFNYPYFVFHVFPFHASSARACAPIFASRSSAVGVGSY